MLPSFWMRNRRPTSWLLGLAGSAAGARRALVAGSVRVRARRVRGRGRPPPSWRPSTATRSIRGRSGVRQRRSRSPPRSPSTSRRAARAWDAPQGDEDNLVALTTAPSDSDGQRAAGARARSGRQRRRARRTTPSGATTRRCDRGSPTARPRRSRRARGRRAARRRRRPRGASRSSASATRCAPCRPPGAAPPTPALALAGPNGAGPTARPPRRRPRARRRPPVPAAELAALAVPARAIGPLDAEQGARSFDNERPGKAADNDTLRAASNELAPGPDRLHPSGGAVG